MSYALDKRQMLTAFVLPRNARLYRVYCSAMHVYSVQFCRSVCFQLLFIVGDSTAVGVTPWVKRRINRAERIAAIVLGEVEFVNCGLSATNARDKLGRQSACATVGTHKVDGWTCRFCVKRGAWAYALCPRVLRAIHMDTSTRSDRLDCVVGMDFLSTVERDPRCLQPRLSSNIKFHGWFGISCFVSMIAVTTKSQTSQLRSSSSAVDLFFNRDRDTSCLGIPTRD